MDQGLFARVRTSSGRFHCLRLTFMCSWQRAVYIVNPSNITSEDALTVPVNKGHEGMAYLTYLIDNYDNLPANIAFLHSHRNGFLRAWHTDTPLHDNVFAMQRLQFDYLQEQGYVNLRCKWNPGCLESHRRSNYLHMTEEIWNDIFTNTSTPPIALLPRSEGGQNSITMPKSVGVACCAQFAVSRDQVRKRPRQDYIAMRDWLVSTELSDAKSGRVLEYLWHIIFGADAVQ